jgi:hypothetical protein
MNDTIIEREKIKLIVQHAITLHEEHPLHASSYRLTYRIKETSREDVPVELFLFRKCPNQSIKNWTEETKTIDHFSTVCSADDLYTYPPNEPDPNMKVPFFRKAEYTLVLETLEKCYNTLHKTDWLLEVLLESIHNLEDAVETPLRVIEV